jgi:hypothetical protein
MRTALTLLILILALAGCADTTATGAGDPASDDPIPVEPDGGTGDGAGPPTEDAAASSGLADQPVPVEGQGDIGDGAGAPAPLTEAPDFGVSSEVDSGVVAPYTYCWSTVSTGACADGFPSSEVTLAAQDQLVVTYAEGELTAGASATFDDQDVGSDIGEITDLPVVMENPGIWLVDISGLEAGQHAIHLGWNGEQGDSFGILDVTIDR